MSTSFLCRLEIRLAASPPLGTPPPSEAPPPWLGKPLHDARQQVKDDFESHYLSHLLQETGGRIAETAQRAGIGERSLYELMRRHGLYKEDFRPSPPHGG